MRTRPDRLFALLVAMVLVAGACAGSDDDADQAEDGGEPTATSLEDRPDAEDLAEEQVLRVFAFFQPPSFDPARQGPATFGGNGLRRQYTEALLRPDKGLEPGLVGAAAEDFEISDDGLVYTFSLREGASYNDGEAVTAGDFVYAWRRLIDPRIPSPLGSIFARVVEGGTEAAALGADRDPAEIDAALDALGLEAVDEGTFEVTLAEVAPFFEWIASLTAGAPLRQDVIEQSGDGWANDPATLITNGPFMVSEMADDATTMVPNPHYWQEDRPRLDRIVARYGLGPAPRWTSYLNDELDISNGPPPASREDALNDARFDGEIVSYPELSIQWLGFNTRRAPFDDPIVRLAFAKAIDRDAYDAIGADTGEPIATLIPEGMPGHNPDIDAQAYDPEEAARLLEASGVDDADLEGIEMLTGPAQETNALLVQDQLEQNLGVNIAVESIGDSATLDSRVAEGDYDIRQTFIGHAANYPDPQDFFDVFLSANPSNQPGWSNPDYDELVDEADTTADLDERLALYDKAHEILAEEAPVVFMVQLERVFWVKPWVRGVSRTLLDTAYMPGDFYTTEITIAEGG